MAQVATLLAMDRTTLTAAVKPLVRRGLVVVFQDPVDRRGRRLSLTGEGAALLARAVPVWEATQAALERQLGAIDADQLRAGLSALT